MNNKKEKLSDMDSLAIQQILTDDEREDTKKSLSDDERRKHEVVEKALELLASEGIYAYIYAYIYADIPNENSIPGIPCVYQFNTLVALMEYDNDGNRILESSEKNAFFHSALWKSLVDTIIQFSPVSKSKGLDKLDPKDPDTHSKRMYFMTYYITECYRDFQNRWMEIYDNPV